MVDATGLLPIRPAGRIGCGPEADASDDTDGEAVTEC